MVPLGTLVRLREVNGPVSVGRYDLYPAASINGNVPPDVSSGETIDAVNRVAAETLPRAMAAEWTDVFYLQIRTGNTGIYVFLLAVVFVFLALSALYESWVRPMVIILTVPLAMFGAIVGLWIYGMPVNVYAQIGLVMLIGLETKNAILIVEFGVEMREKHGMSIIDSAKAASREVETLAADAAARLQQQAVAARERLERDSEAFASSIVERVLGRNAS
jgi:HAE1 family hydrophobic/amphiphilic exporter-1